MRRFVRSKGKLAHRGALAAGLLGLALVLAGCAPQGQGAVGRTPGAATPAGVAGARATPAATAGAQGEYVVEMTDQLKFEPATITVPRGATVTWRNTGQQVHTVTADPAKALDKSHIALPSGAQAFDSGNITAGQSWSHTFTTPGTYKYVCLPHESAGMLGTVVVTE